MPAAVAWIAWSPSTSAVEQNWSKMQVVASALSSSISDAWLATIMAVACTHVPQSEEEQLLEKALKLWKQYFPNARQCSKQRRLDFGRKHKRAANARTTEKDIIAKRENDVSKQVAEWRSAGLHDGAKRRTMDASRTAWTPKLQAEETFQKGKQFTRLAQSFLEGAALESEIAEHDDFDARAYRLVEKQDKYGTENMRQREAKRARVQRSGPAIGVDWRVHRLHEVGLSREVKDAAEMLGMALTKERTDATAFVVDSIGKPGQRTEICAIMNGAMTMTVDFLQTSGQSGAMVRYQRPAKKRIWASPAWDAAHAHVRQLLDRIIAQSGGHYIAVAGVAAAELRVAASRHQHRGQLLALVTPTEKALIDYDKTMTLLEFLCTLRRFKTS